MLILQEFLGLLMNSRLLLQLFVQQLREREITEDMIRTTFISGVCKVYFHYCVSLRKNGRPPVRLDPPPAGPPAASQSGWSLFVSAGAAAQCFSPPSSSCWQFLMTSRSLYASGLWRSGICPEGVLDTLD